MLEAAKDAVRRMDYDERAHLTREGVERLSQEQVDRILGSLMDQLTESEKREFAEWLYTGHLKALHQDEVAETNRDLLQELWPHLEEAQAAGLRSWQAYDHLPPHLQDYMYTKTWLDCTRWEGYRTAFVTWWDSRAPKWLSRRLRKVARQFAWSKRQREILAQRTKDRGVYDEDAE
jgi:hypothetical protein